MSKFTTNITMQTDKEIISSSKSGDSFEVFKFSQEVTGNDATVILLANSTVVTQSALRSSKGLLVTNKGDVGAEVVISHDGWSDNGGASDGSPNTTSAVTYRPSMRDISTGNCYMGPSSSNGGMIIIAQEIQG